MATKPDMTRRTVNEATSEAFDNPAIVRALIELSRTNELAMESVRCGLAFHVQRRYRLMHGGASPPEDPPEVLAAVQEALSRCLS